MNLLTKIKTNHMPRKLYWFFVYTLVTFIIGILCKLLVAIHVNDMHNQLSKTYDLFHTASSMPGKNLVLNSSGEPLTLGDLFALQFLAENKNQVSAGDGSLNRFLIYSKHFSGNESTFALLEQQMINLNFKDLNALTSTLNSILSMPKILDPLAGFQKDIALDAIYALKMSNEANSVFWLQIGLIILTILAYPYGLYKMWKIKFDYNKKYTANMHKRLIIEYSLFLLFFVIIDTYATYLLISENVPMSFWNAFSVSSMAIPTIFAIGSLAYILFLNKKLVFDKENLKWNILSKFKTKK